MDLLLFRQNYVFHLALQTCADQEPGNEYGMSYKIIVPAVMIKKKEGKRSQRNNTVKIPKPYY